MVYPSRIFKSVLLSITSEPATTWISVHVYNYFGEIDLILERKKKNLEKKMQPHGSKKLFTGIGALADLFFVFVVLHKITSFAYTY